MKKLWIIILSLLIVSENIFSLFSFAADTSVGKTITYPSGTEILSDIKGSGIGHPRILYTSEEAEYIKSKIDSDSSYKKAYNRIIALADTECAKSFSSTYADEDKQAAATSFQTSMQYLAEAYLISGTAKYADKAIENMLSLCSWDNLAIKTSNLTTGHWAMGMAIGYDSFYDYIKTRSDGDEILLTIKTASKNLVFDETIRSYKEESGYQAHWMRLNDNFLGVIGGGVMSLAIAMAEETDLETEITYLLENVLKTNATAASLFSPDGGYFEGVSYAEYLLYNLTISMEALFECCGTDYGIGSADGFESAGDFFVYMQTPQNSFNFHDCDRGVYTNCIPYWLGLRYGNTETAVMNYKQNKLRNINEDLRELLIYDQMLDKYPEADADEYSPDKYFESAGTGSFRNSFDTETTVFAGFHGGKNGVTHSMLDLGEFVFESDNVQWAISLGKDMYSLPDYFGNDGYKIYRKKTEGKNCLVINPKTEADSYFGQSTDAEALLTNYKTDSKGAMAVLDLRDAYSRDVNSYNRGYYFGDNRNTLIVQDELSLKSASELYWFMHTEADITIESNNKAILVQNGKKLTVEFYCSAAGAELSVMDAKKLPDSPEVEGENQNDGIRKLALYIPSASDDVTIAAKLIPESEYFDTAPLINDGASSVQKISDWDIPEGEMVSKLVFTDLYTDASDNFCAAVQTMSGYEEAEIYVDNIKLDEFTLIPNKVNRISTKNIANVSPGAHIARLVVYDSEGNKQSKSAMFFKKNYTAQTELSAGLTSSDPSEIKNYNYTWALVRSGVCTANADCLKFTASKEATVPHLRYTILNNNTNSSYVKGVSVFEFDVKFSGLNGYFSFECKNSDGTWFLHDKKIFDNGKLINNDTYEADKWYKVTLAVDLDNQLCNVYVDGKRVLYDESIPAAHSLSLCKLQYTYSLFDTDMSVKNIKISTMTKQIDMPTSALDVYDGVISACIANVTDNDADVMIAQYSGNELLDVTIKKAEDLAADMISDYLLEETDTIKLLVWNELSPLCEAKSFKK